MTQNYRLDCFRTVWERHSWPLLSNKSVHFVITFHLYSPNCNSQNRSENGVTWQYVDVMVRYDVSFNVCQWEFLINILVVVWINFLSNDILFRLMFGLVRIRSICRRQIKCCLNDGFVSVFDRIENVLGKGENAGYQHFLLHPQCFQKASS